MRIAVIGSGVAGLSSAYLLNQRFDVTVFEAAGRIGGHVNTVELDLPDGRLVVDTGFIVFNEDYYPQLTRLFAWLGVASQPTDMCFGVSVGDGWVEYAGNRYGFFAQPRNLVRPRFVRMMIDIARFNEIGRAFLLRPDQGEPTLGEFLGDHGFSEAFADLYLYPLAGAIWSAPRVALAEFPARRLLRFFAGHGLLELQRRRRWRTVVGGGREYLNRLTAGFAARIRTSQPVRAVLHEHPGFVLVLADGQRQRFDRVVVACHADEALAILPTLGGPARRLLQSFRFQRNRAVLHSDPVLMPRRRAAWASWNYVAERAPQGTGGRAAMVTYWMNRLQRLSTDRLICLTLNPFREPRQELTLGEFAYSHPVLDHSGVTAQTLMATLQGRDGLWFAGAWLGDAFHEDGLVSALRIAQAFGIRPPWEEQPTRDSAAGLPERAAASPA